VSPQIVTTSRGASTPASRQPPHTGKQAAIPHHHQQKQRCLLGVRRNKSRRHLAFPSPSSPSHNPARLTPSSLPRCSAPPRTLPHQPTAARPLRTGVCPRPRSLHGRRRVVRAAALRDRNMRHAAAAAALRVSVLGLLVLGLALPPPAAALRPLREHVASAGAAASSGSWADEVRRCWIARLASFPHFLLSRQGF
jgi:hypothetical protein